MYYFDYNATHPPIEEIIEKNWKKYLSEFANPSGISALSQKNQAWIESSRRTILKLLELPAHGKSRLCFVSTGTEAIYLMVKSFAQNGFVSRNPVQKNSENQQSISSTSNVADRNEQHCILSPYEHDAMFAACKDQGLIIHTLPSTPEATVNPDDVKNTIDSLQCDRKHISFISVMFVSNETGVIQPVEEISQIARQYNIPFLSDTIQGAGKLQMPVEAFDGFVLNGHKLGAGPGAAATILQNRQFRALFGGGLQEDENRAGTENLPAIGSLADAYSYQCERQKSNPQARSSIQDFRRKIEDALKDCSATIVAEKANRIHSTVYAIFPEMENMDFFMLGLDQKGFAYSTGSSCKSRTRQPSKVLQSMGYSEADAMKALRFSIGLFTTESDIDTFCKTIPELYRKSL